MKLINYVHIGYTQLALGSCQEIEYLMMLQPLPYANNWMITLAGGRREKLIICYIIKDIMQPLLENNIGIHFKWIQNKKKCQCSCFHTQYSTFQTSVLVVVK